jgi:hypothetical protein
MEVVTSHVVVCTVLYIRTYVGDKESNNAYSASGSTRKCVRGRERVAIPGLAIANPRYP